MEFLEFMAKFNLWIGKSQVSQHLSMLYVPQMFFKTCRKTK